VVRPIDYPSGIGRTFAPLPHPPPKPSVWQDLFAGTAGDIKRLPSRQTFGLLAIGAMAAAGTRAADKGVSRSLSANKTLEEPLEPGAVLGSTPFQLGASITTYAVARLTNHPRLAQVGADLVRAQLIAEGLTIGMKQSFRRPRPEGSGYSFPSGHTTVSFASATVLQRHYGWKLGLPAYGVASYVALSRVQMRRHYLSDVAFGAALGIVAGRTVTFGRGPTFAISPAAASGGAGLQFTLVPRR
jgi:membrane-associated phospholipid phosphatase